MPRHSILLALGLALAACGSGGDLRRCGADADCGPGAVCERPVSGEQGVCVAPYAVALVAPAPGSFIGTGPVAVRATLRVQASGRSEPAALDLAVGGTPAGSLARVGPGVYQGSWTALAGTPAAVSLSAVAAAGTPDESRSPPVAVRVDLEAPVFTGQSATCAATPCVRDAALHLLATVADANLVAVTATLDLAPSRTVALAPTPSGWRADVDLASLPFPALARDVAVTLLATDAAGNQAALPLLVPVTRVRWAYDAGAPVTSPAVMGDGTLVVGVSATANQVRAIRPDGTLLWQATVGAGVVTAAPSIGPSGIWVSSADASTAKSRPAADPAKAVSGIPEPTAGVPWTAPPVLQPEPFRMALPSLLTA